VLDDASTFKRNIGTRPHRVDAYMEDVREIERRLEIAKKASSAAPTPACPTACRIPSTSTSVCSSICRLSLPGNITRVSTLLYARILRRAFIRKRD